MNSDTSDSSSSNEKRSHSNSDGRPKEVSLVKSEEKNDFLYSLDLIDLTNPSPEKEKWVSGTRYSARVQNRSSGRASTAKGHKKSDKQVKIKVSSLLKLRPKTAVKQQASTANPKTTTFESDQAKSLQINKGIDTGVDAGCLSECTAKKNGNEHDEQPPDGSSNSFVVNAVHVNREDKTDDDSHALLFQFRGFGGNNNSISVPALYATKEHPKTLLRMATYGTPGCSKFIHPVSTDDLCSFFELPQLSRDGGQEKVKAYCNVKRSECRKENEPSVPESAVQPFIDAPQKERVEWQRGLVHSSSFVQPPMISSHSVLYQHSGHLAIHCFFNLYHFVIVQPFKICFYELSAIGSSLDEPDTWAFVGSLTRQFYDNDCTLKEIAESAIYLPDTNIAFVELWVKECKPTDGRRLCVLYVLVYFTHKFPVRRRIDFQQITGACDEVAHVVMKHENCIVVQWICDTAEGRMWYMRSYYFNPHFEAVYSVRAFEYTHHTIQRLHNVDNCSMLLCGYGDGMLSLWNLQARYKAFTVDLSLQTPPHTRNVCIKTDRGIIFFLQFDESKCTLRLIGLNALSLRWKVMKTFRTPQDMDCTNYRGACMENGFLIACFESGVICWRMNDANVVTIQKCDTMQYHTLGSTIITVLENRVQVQNALAYVFNAHTS